MKLIIQIPCYNEAQTLPVTLAELPRQVEGFDCVQWLVVNDGSTDATAEVAREHGVDHIVNLINNQGLAKAFIAGLDACVKLGADVIVNTDADNQYNSADIVKLVEPILQGKADYVIGARPIEQIAHFSLIKKMLQNLGSRAVRIVSRTDIPDAPSGFRAVSRDGAMRLNVFNEYTYTLETIIQAGQKNMALCSVPVRVNKDLRPSRLIKNAFGYVNKSIVTIFRIFVTYKPFRFFMTIGLILFSAGVVLGLRYIYFVFAGTGRGHIQSVILCGALLAMGFQTMLIAFMADLLSVNRKLLEDLQYRIRKKETQQSKHD
jgi:glycosyltransferase involved in cell wall biosynthesis